MFQFQGFRIYVENSIGSFTKKFTRNSNVNFLGFRPELILDILKIPPEVLRSNSYSMSSSVNCCTLGSSTRNSSTGTTRISIRVLPTVPLDPPGVSLRVSLEILLGVSLRTLRSSTRNPSKKFTENYSKSSTTSSNSLRNSTGNSSRRLLWKSLLELH